MNSRPASQRKQQQQQQQRHGISSSSSIVVSVGSSSVGSVSGVGVGSHASVSKRQAAAQGLGIHPDALGGHRAPSGARGRRSASTRRGLMTGGHGTWRGHYSRVMPPPRPLSRSASPRPRPKVGRGVSSRPPPAVIHAGVVRARPRPAPPCCEEVLLGPFVSRNWPMTLLGDEEGVGSFARRNWPAAAALSRATSGSGSAVTPTGRRWSR